MTDRTSLAITIIGAAVILAALIILLVASVFGHGSSLGTVSYADPTSGISVSYPAVVFKEAAKDTNGTIVLKDETSSSSPAFRIAVVKASPDKLDQTYAFYQKGETNTVGSSGHLDVATDTAMSGLRGYTVKGSIGGSLLYFFVTEDVLHGEVTAFEMLVPAGDALPAGATAESIFDGVVASYKAR